MARRVFLALISLAVASLSAARLDAADLAYVPKWPTLQPVAPPPSPFIFETGLRYWYSGGNIRLGFANNSQIYWGLFATGGVVNFGPAFDQNFPLNRFEQQRYGILLELKGRL